ncbi:MAG: GTP-binding protein [Gammaproteobacteria bacterium]|nr:GTP-binding protein [Gammaproteobacteria bacterium]
MSSGFFEESSKDAYDLTITLAGAGQVGKTSLITRLEFGAKMNIDPTQTAGVNFSIIKKTFIIQKKTLFSSSTEEKFMLINVSDTVGQERYKSIIRSSYAQTNVLLLIYDVTNKQSLERAIEESREFREINADKPIIVIGNKCDQKPIITTSDAQERIDADSVYFLGEFSALESIWKPKPDTTITAEEGAIQKLFTEIVRIWLVHNKEISEEDDIRMKQPKGAVKLSEDSDQQTTRTSNGCC